MRRFHHGHWGRSARRSRFFTGRRVRDGRFFGEGFYRARRGKIFGVCQGLADHFGLSVTGVRIVAVLLLIFTGFWPVLGIYLLAALIMKPEPAVPLSDEGEQEFYDSYVNSRKRALDRLKRTYDNLNRRVRRMEDVVTAKEFDWERRFNGG